MSTLAHKNTWRNFWDVGFFKNWHLTTKNPDLWNFFHHLYPDVKDKSGLFFVPMCGKCLDVKFLYEEGFNVVGVELLEEVVKEFFTENSLTYEVKKVSDTLKLYNTLDKRLRIFNGDLLTMKKEYLDGETISAVWDRGAFGSIWKDLKKPYVRVMKELMGSSKVRYLLHVFQFKDWYRAAPPNNIPLEMLEELFGDRFEIEELQRVDYQIGGNPICDVVDGNEVIYLMRSK